jgi:hypothetical protein
LTAGLLSNTKVVAVRQGRKPQRRAHLAATPVAVQANTNFFGSATGFSGMAIAVAPPVSSSNGHIDTHWPLHLWNMKAV